MRRFLFRLLNTFRSHSAEHELTREIESHLALIQADFERKGLSAVDARQAALRAYGGVEQGKELHREARSFPFLDQLFKDLRYTARTLVTSPGFSLVAIVTLALGIGANTAMFSLINALMLRSLPVQDPQRLVHITRIDADGKPLHVSWPLFQYFRDHLKSVSASSAERDEHPGIVIDGADEVVNAEAVSGDHYRVLGIEPVAGRLLQPADDTDSSASRAAVISYRYWQRRFGLNAAAIGKTFTFVGRPGVFTIVGVTPRWYHGAVVGDEPDISLPVTMMFRETERTEPTYNNFQMLGRLAPDFTREQANAELQVLWRAFQQRVAATLPERDRPAYLQERAAVLSGRNGFDPLRDRYSEALFVLMGIVALILFLTCANLSGLLLARAEAREREILIRVAVGAGRGRLVRQFLTESFVLAALGGSAGLFLAWWSSTALVTTLANSKAVALSTAPDWHVLVFTVVLSLLACILAGLAPALHSLRTSVQWSSRQPSSERHQQLGKALVIAQVAVSMVLVTGAALFTATLLKLYGVNRGLHTSGVLTFTLRTSAPCPPARCRPAAHSLLDQLRRIPGVSSASAVDVLPISGSLWDRDVEVQGYAFRSGEDQTAAFNAIAPQYFSTVRTPLLRGREFTTRDTGSSPNVAVINESFARYFFGSASPLGRRVTSVRVTYEIVGVVADAKYTDLKQPLLKTMWIPWTQRTEEEPIDFRFLVRVAEGDPERLSPTVEKLVQAVDPVLRVNTTTTWSAVANQTIVTERIMAVLGSFFGLLALIVACLGIFGVTAFRVSRRANEIGVRMALGASRSSIAGLVLREAAGMLLAGSIIGSIIALGLTRLTSSMLFEVSPTDPGVFAAAAAVLILVGLLAGWLPARRAARVDPLIALRSE